QLEPPTGAGARARGHRHQRARHDRLPHGVRAGHDVHDHLRPGLLEPATEGARRSLGAPHQLLEPVGRTVMAHLVTAVIKPLKLEEVKDALRASGVLGLSVSEIQGYGRQGGKTETFRGSEYSIDFVPKVRLEVIVESAKASAVVELIATTAR